MSTDVYFREMSKEEQVNFVQDWLMKSHGLKRDRAKHLAGRVVQCIPPEFSGYLRMFKQDGRRFIRLVTAGHPKSDETGSVE